MDVGGIIDRAKAEASRRLARAASHLANELKVTLSVPAPRKKARGSGRVYAATPATPGAPPRKVTGRGRAAVAWELVDNGAAAVVGIGTKYMPRHERKGHPYVGPTLARCRPRLDAILKGTA